MKRTQSISAFALLGVAMALFTAMSSPALAEKRVALVIGNNDYRNVPKLQKAVNDARAMGDTLKKLGFEVMVAHDGMDGLDEGMLTLPGHTGVFLSLAD